MGKAVGFVKYVVFTPLTVVGFLSLYAFGGAIITFFNTFHNLFLGNFLKAFVEYYIHSALPPTSIGQVLWQTGLGSVIAGIKWVIGMTLAGR